MAIEDSQLPSSTENNNNENNNNASAIAEINSNSSKLFATKKINVVLDDHNYLLWHQQVFLIVKTHRLQKFIDCNVHPPPQYITQNSQVRLNHDFEAFEEQDGALATWLLSTVSESVLPHLIGLNTASEIWNTLHRIYSGKTTSRLMYFRRSLHAQKKGELSMKDFLMKIKSICDNLASCGEVISEHEKITAILNGLPPEYESVITVLTAGDTSSTVNSVRTVLLDAEARQSSFTNQIVASAHIVTQSLPSQNALISQPHNNNSSLGSGPAQSVQIDSTGFSYVGRDNNNRGRGKGRSSRPQCQLCGHMGHLVERCYYRFDINFKNESSRNSDRGYTNAQANNCNYSSGPSVSPVNFPAVYYVPSSTSSTGFPSPHMLIASPANPFLPSVAPPIPPNFSANRSALAVPWSPPIYTQVPVASAQPQISAQACIATPETIDDNAWYPDSGATHHLTKDFSNLQDNQVSLEFFPSYCQARDLATREVVLKGCEDAGLYKLDLVNNKSAVNTLQSAVDVIPSHCFSTTVKNESVALWHQRLGLTGFTALEGYFEVIGSILEVGNDVLLLGNGWVMIWGCFGKMGCLYSVFDVKKQGKTVWVVRARNWKLRGGENRLSGLLEGVSCENRLSGVARACVGEALRVVAPLSDRRVRGIEILPGYRHENPVKPEMMPWDLGMCENDIASLGEGKEARRIHLDLCSSTVFENYVQSDVDLTPDWDTVFFAALIITIGCLNAFRKHNKKVLNFRVVYRSWTFGFDSDIPRVTISGRFCDWTGSRGLHLLVSEPGYALIGTVSERAPVCWAETRQKLSPLVDILKGTTEKVKLICDQLKIASDRQKSYVDLKCREIEYVVGDRSEWFSCLPVVVASRVERIHDVFHVSMLRRYRSDLSHVMPVEEIELYTDMSYDEEPVEILTSDGKVLRGRTIELVKVKWRHRGMEEATWERKEDMRECYNVELMFAASFDSKMGCLYSVFDVKKQGKTVWVVRARNWKLRGGENRLSGLLEGVSVSGNCENRLSGVARACVGEALRVVAPLSDRRVRGIEILPGYRHENPVKPGPRVSRGFDLSGIFQAYALFPTMQIASLGEGKEARRIHLDLCSSTVFENYGSMIKQWGGLPYLGAFQSDVDLTPDWDTVFFAALIITIGCLNAFRKHNKKVLNFRVVYRSWTFGFDSDIPRVTISGRFCDWTGSRGKLSSSIPVLFKSTTNECSTHRTLPQTTIPSSSVPSNDTTSSTYSPSTLQSSPSVSPVANSSPSHPSSPVSDSLPSVPHASTSSDRATSPSTSIPAIATTPLHNSPSFHNSLYHTLLHSSSNTTTNNISHTIPSNHNSSSPAISSPIPSTNNISPSIPSNHNSSSPAIPSPIPSTNNISSTIPSNHNSSSPAIPSPIPSHTDPSHSTTLPSSSVVATPPAVIPSNGSSRREENRENVRVIKSVTNCCNQL
ncbi:hypothetical protein GQ457_11G032360 [Hibiscus cannabinus]